MLVHICCAVDSHYFLQKLKIDYPNEKLIGFFYDPNIQPYSEYKLRLLDVKRSCQILNIELIEGDYDVDSWLKVVKGYEKEPEKGARCAICFDKRFKISAKKASEVGEKSFTSTLLTSPKKSLTQLAKAGDKLAKEYNIKFISPDYRKSSGTQEQNILAKKDKLYRQDYCGCIYGLTAQRESQDRLADELMMPISNQIQPESIEERLKLYDIRLKYEEWKIEYRIIKQRFLNWRILNGLVRVRGEIIPSHFLPYSSLKGKYTRGKIEYSIDNLHYMNRDEVRFLNLSKYNLLTGFKYKSVKELMFNPPRFEAEEKLRLKLENMPYSIGVIVVVNTIPDKKIEILLDSKLYFDVREILLRTEN